MADISPIEVSPELDSWMRETRRYLHMNPELSLQENNTSRLVSGHLNELGIKHRTGVGGDGRSLYIDAEQLKAAGITPGPTTGGTGILGTIEGRKPGNVLLIRADMDALPIDELNDVSYKSTKPGVMHACGHDAHTTILMGVAEMLNARRDQFDGTVKLMFQPAEEGPGGAVAMIHDKILDDPKVDAAVALHVSPLWRAGQIGVSGGFSSAASDRVQITVHGVGGHAARPHMSVDSTIVASQILLLLQTIVSREIDPFEQAVITFGMIHSGGAPNVIPDTAVLNGTVRTYSPEVRDHIEKRVKEIAAGIGLAMRTEVEVAYLRGYPALHNDPEMSELVRAAATDVLGAENVFERKPGMGGEDMAFVAQKVPTCMFNLGIANPEQGKIYAPHHPRFDIDEDAMATGVKVMVASALKYLNG